MQVDVSTARGLTELFAIGAALDEGKTHLAAVFGIEHGWLLERFANLDISEATLMSERRIHRVLVVDDGKLTGIVSALDVVSAVAKTG